ncbi:MAG: type II toxin-antitoxin system VapC family toxin [Acidobacteriota bacterium]|nr:type II toxin-antitoxin system VapC family toxin [Acidobacteriota bacterium]
MTLIDANVLLYAYDSESPFQKASARWLETELSSGRSVSFALVTLLAFVRIASDRRVFSRPLTPAEACSLIEGWLALPNARLLQPGPRTWKILSEVCGSGQARGPMVMDAHLAALALEHGASITTTDRDFTRFPGIDLMDPTEATSHQA